MNQATKSRGTKCFNPGILFQLLPLPHYLHHSIIFGGFNPHTASQGSRLLVFLAI
jgi:hypothetical protein